MMHARYIHSITHLMNSDITDIKHFIEEASLAVLNRRYIIKLCKSHIIYEERPSYINHTTISNNPYIRVPIEDFVEHYKKQKKQIGLKKP